jgi:uncharacterized repeat protein (TIGR02543 family)
MSVTVGSATTPGVYPINITVFTGQPGYPSYSEKARTTYTLTVTGPAAVSITITSSPVTGLGFVKVDGSAITTPTTFTWTIGSNHTLAALSPVSDGTGIQYVWTSWSDGGNQTHTYTVPSTSRTVTANYKTQYYLTVVSPYDTPGGAGWYDSGTTAYATLATGTVDIVPGWVKAVFTGWGGDASGTGLTSDPITMNGPKNAIANWEIQYYLTVVTDPSKLVSIPGEDWYANCTWVTLTAPQYVPSEAGLSGVRYNFTYWDVDGTSQGTGVNPINIHMNAPHTATAHYIVQYYLTVISPHDTPSGDGWYDGGTNAYATITDGVVSGGAGVQYVFTGWGGDASGTGLTSDPILMDGPKTATANWKTQYCLTVVSLYDTPGGAGWYDSGTTAYATLATGTVDIVPGWVKAVFTGWGGDASGTGLTSDPITMNGPKTAIADWEIQYYLSVVTDPSKLVSIPGEDWYANCTWVTLTSPQYVPNATGISGVRYNFTYWDVDGASQGTGVNPINIHMNAPHIATAHFTLQFLVTFNQTGVGSDFNGTVVIIDGSNYDVSTLPAPFWWDSGSTHNFAFLSPLVVPPGAKQYDWASTSGLSTLQLDPITITASGSVTGNYVIRVHDVAVTDVVAVVPHCASKVGNGPWVFQGLPVYINVTVLNKGDFNETVTVILYYNITANKIIDTQNITVAIGESATLSFVWDTTNAPYCHNYTITAVAAIPADDYPADNTLSDGAIKVRIMGDINGDGKVDIKDILICAKNFGSVQGDARYNSDADMNSDGKVNIKDILTVAKHFGICAS